MTLPVKRKNDHWTTAIEHLSDQFSQRSHDNDDDTSRTADYDALHSAFERLIETAIEQSHGNWEPGHACPECGENDLTRWVAFPELTKHKDGYSTFRDGSNCGTEFAWDCPHCETILATSPAALLTSPLPGDPPSDIEVLTDRLHEETPDVDWRHGTACPDCGIDFIWEEPIDAYAVTSRDGEWTQGSYGERISTIEFGCDSCGTPLQQDLAAVVMNDLSL